MAFADLGELKGPMVVNPAGFASPARGRRAKTASQPSAISRHLLRVGMRQCAEERDVPYEQTKIYG
jgi:hypothetical protein